MIDYLEDKAYTVRLFVINSLEKYFDFLEIDYIIDNIHKPLLALATSESKFYTFRITAIKGLSVILQHTKLSDKIKTEIVKSLFSLTEDKIANVR